jgi:hypothetical protein
MKRLRGIEGLAQILLILYLLAKSDEDRVVPSQLNRKYAYNNQVIFLHRSKYAASSRLPLSTYDF